MTFHTGSTTSRSLSETLHTVSVINTNCTAGLDQICSALIHPTFTPSFYCRFYPHAALCFILHTVRVYKVEAGRSRGTAACGPNEDRSKEGENKSGWFNIAAVLQLNPNHTEDRWCHERRGGRGIEMERRTRGSKISKREKEEREERTEIKARRKTRVWKSWSKLED